MPFSSNIQLARAVGNHPVLIVPGLHNSDEDHWQTYWQAALPYSKRIAIDNWSTPDLEKWRNGIKQSLETINEPAIIIAHSFGTLASASIAEEYADKIAALFLVAPADPDKFAIADDLPQSVLPVETKIIASSNDPWMTDNKAAYWALQWGADFLRLKNVGHINSQSNIGFWPEGIRELHQLVRKAKRNHHKNQSQSFNDCFAA